MRDKTESPLAGKREFVERYTVDEMRNILRLRAVMGGSSTLNMHSCLFPHFGLMPRCDEVADVLAYSDKKYSPLSWQHVNPLLFIDAYMRHALRDDIDESGLHHHAHRDCNAMFLAWHQAEGNIDIIDGRFVDSRPVQGEAQ